MRKLIFILPLLLFVAAMVFLARQNGRNPDVDTFSLLNQPLPNFSLPDLAQPQQRVSPAAWRGHAYLLNIWATWCTACAQEHAQLVRMAGEQVPIYGVLYKDQRSAALDDLSQHGNPYRQVVDDAVGDFGVDLGVTGAPETLIVDAQGIIRYHMDGPIDAQIWQQRLRPLLQRWSAQP